jgi:ubiquinol oxidase
MFTSVWMSVSHPSFLERMLVVFAQIAYTTFYTFCYIISPRFAHRLVGYLEEEAVAAYSMLLDSIDKGEIKNALAPEIAR